MLMLMLLLVSLLLLLLWLLGSWLLFIVVAALVDDVVTVFGLLLLVTLYNHVPIGVTTGEHSNQDRICSAKTLKHVGFSVHDGSRFAVVLRDSAVLPRRYYCCDRRR